MANGTKRTIPRTTDAGNRVRDDLARQLQIAKA